MKLNGNIISGDFDQVNNEFMLEKVKQFTTESALNEKQLNALYEYLNKNTGVTDGLILTLYDQMLVHLSQEDISQFLQDLNEVKSLYH
ncbi:hypothetical protein [Bacillus sp. Marseille-Q3570]|uniref:hypothetical protein n=1 Tax=Bacillus sp. Marseille-Q3570 TaxID=2963522 RepID=UPI0021B744DF|nr:hypothetical protein [Bacillus sp. Marseille-Q3570]